MDKYNVILYGLGYIGIEAAKLVLTKKNLCLVGIVDIDPKKVDKDIGEILGIKKKLGIKVIDSVSKLTNISANSIAIHTTSSFISVIRPELLKLISSGFNVVSSSEELLYPYQRDTGFVNEIDAKCKEKNVTVLGTGVNPGFIMDIVPLTLSGVCLNVRSISVKRVVDAGKRRLPLQKKVGAGIDISEFKMLKKTGRFGHIGLQESLKILAKGVGFKLDHIELLLDAIVAKKNLETKYLKVKTGKVAGIKNIAIGYINGKEKIKLDLQMYVGAKDQDSVLIEGDPPINMVIKGGISGDKATGAMLINSIPRVINSPAGLMTIANLPPATCF
jgi:4-hydroxy-tetrahydrodipicolinate reductase